MVDPVHHIICGYGSGGLLRDEGVGGSLPFNYNIENEPKTSGKMCEI